MSQATDADMLIEVRFLPPEEGGLDRAIASDHFDCSFQYWDVHYDCRLLLAGIGPIGPGQPAVVPMKILSPHFLAGQVRLGDGFYISQGGRRIAQAMVEQLERSMTEIDIEPLLADIRQRWSEIVEGSSQEGPFLLHLRSLGREDERDVYPETEVEFPPEIYIAYAVCHPDCGREEFIVEGSTQECQKCGRLMYRTETREYVRK